MEENSKLGQRGRRTWRDQGPVSQTASGFAEPNFSDPD